MVRSIMMKGLEALVCECVLAGRRAGVIETVLDSLDDTYPGFDWRRRSAFMLERVMTHGVRPIEQVTQGSQAQLCSRCGWHLAQLLDVGGYMHTLDRSDLRDALCLKPIEEFPRRSRIGAARVRVPDLRREEFEKAIGSALTDGGDQRGSASDYKGRELVHAVKTLDASNGI
jgi:hypothetical protein